MSIKTMLAASFTALLMWVPAAYAENFYLGASGLGVDLQDANTETSLGDLEAEFDLGYGARAFAGTTVLLDQLRLELEGSYRENDVDKLTDGASVGADGDFRAIAGMVNAYFDFDFIPLVTPYIGGGVGAANIEADIDAGGVNLVDDDDTVFAYQAAAGLSFDFLPLVTVFAGYRYFATLDPEFEAPGGTSFDSEYESHNAELGLLVRF